MNRLRISSWRWQSMIRQIKLLTALELKHFFNINRMLHTKDRKEKSKFGGILAAYIIVIAFVCIYVAMIVGAVCSIGAGDLAVSLLVAVSSLIIAFFGIFKAGGVMFAKKGHDQLCSLPLYTEAVVFSRFISMYLEDLALSFLIMTPGVVSYGIILKPSFSFYLFAFVGALFIPMLPLVVSTVVGTVITALSSRMKHKSIIQTLFSLLMIFGIYYISFTSNSLDDPSQMEQTIGKLGSALAKIYPPAIWLAKGIYTSDILSVLLFVAVSILALAVVIWIVARFFHSICNVVFATASKSNYKLTKLKAQSALKALTKRELKRYFASSIYVTNTIMGPVMGLAVSVVLLFTWKNIPLAELPYNIASALPFGLCWIFCMMPPTSSAVSLEGKELWIAKSLPISPKAFVDAKLLTTILLFAPFYAVSVLLLAITTKPDIEALVWLVVTSAVLMLFYIVFGLAVDMKFHNCDYESEAQVVKQSMPATISCIGGMFINAVLAGASLFAPITLFNGIVCACALLLTWLLYRWMIRCDIVNI